MEDVLDVYARPYDPRVPVICMDEASKQLVGEVRDPLPLRPGDPLRNDSEYVRLGTCNLFLFCEPLRGWRQVRVTERRTKVDWADALRDFLNEHYREAEKIVLVKLRRLYPEYLRRDLSHPSPMPTAIYN